MDETPVVSNLKLLGQLVQDYSQIAQVTTM